MTDSQTLRTIGWGAATIVAAVAVVLLVMVAAQDDHRDRLYREAQAEGRAIGPTTGRLDDGTSVGAATFYDDEGTICTIFGPPGERGDDLYCVADTDEEVDAINWEVDPEAGIHLTVALVDGEAPTVGFGFDGPTPGNATATFRIQKPAAVTVYVGPPWDDLDVSSAG